jgi:hypothetical protein
MTKNLNEFQENANKELSKTRKTKQDIEKEFICIHIMI